MSDMPPIQPASVLPAISLDMYTWLVDMRASLDVINEKLNAIPDHEQRIRRLEASRAKLIGAAVAATTTSSALGTWLGLLLTHH